MSASSSDIDLVLRNAAKYKRAPDTSMPRLLVWALMVLLTLTGAFLRLYMLERVSLWDGEIFTLLFAQYDWGILLQSVSAFSAHPPLWFVLTKLAISGGWNEMILRIPAAFAGILSVPAIFVLGKRLFDARVGVLGAALLAFSPMDVIFSQNARNYAFFVLLVISLLYAVVRGLVPQPLSTRQELERYALPPFARLGFETYRARWWILFVLSAIVGLYTHYLFGLPLAGVLLAAGYKYLVEIASEVRGLRRASVWLRTGLGIASPFLISLAVIGALYAPWVPTVRSAFFDRQLTREAANDEEATELTLQDAPRLVKDFSGNADWGLVVFAALAVVGIAAAVVNRKREALFWFGIAILLPIGVTVVLAPRRLPAKYLIYLLPAYLLFVANGIAGVSDFARSRLKSERLAATATAALLAILVIASAPNMPYWNGKQTIFTGKGWAVVDDWQPWRQVAARVVTRARPGDIVLFPNEARAVTARSVAPYFDEAFLKKLYSVPPTGRVWWVSERRDVPQGNAPFVREEKRFGDIVVQELQHPPTFAQGQLTNPSFENEFEGWELGGNSAIWIAEKRDVTDGSTAARVTIRSPRYTPVRSAEFPVTPGKLYRVTVDVKNPTVGFYTVSPQLFVNFYDATNKAPRRTRLATLAPTDRPGWWMMVEEGIVPEDATLARIEFGFREYARDFAPTSWLDNVQIWVEQ